MITSANQKIKSYLPIDRLGEGYAHVTPADGETFVGIPYGWYGETSHPFIEVVKDGSIIRSINCSDISEIIFES